MQLWNCTYQITNHLSFYMCKINVWLVVLTCCIIQSGLVLIRAWIASPDVCSNKLVNKKYWPFQSRIQLTLRDDKDRCPHVHWYWSTSPLQPGILFYKYKKSTIALDYYVFSKCLSDQQQIIEGLVWLIRLMQLALVSGDRPIRHIMVNTGPWPSCLFTYVIAGHVNSCVMFWSLSYH